MVEGLVSILCPAYRAHWFLGRMVESILSQTYTKWELIIVDDGEDDQQVSVIHRAVSHEKGFVRSKVRVFRIPHSGYSDALNVALSYSNGQFIARQDADDWSEPTRLERQIQKLTDDQADLVSCLMVRVREGGKKTLGRDVGGTGCIPRDFCTVKGTEIKGPAAATIIAKREVYEKVGGWRTDCPGHKVGSTDADWIFRVLTIDPPFVWSHIHEELYCYRDHGAQTTKTHRAIQLADFSSFQAQYAPTILARLDREAKMKDPG